MQFNVFFDAANSPDLGSLSASEQQAILDTANAAATIWSWYLTTANITLDLAIDVDNSMFSGSVLAVAGPANFIPTGDTFGGDDVYEAITAIELRTGQDQNGSDPDLFVALTVSSIRSMLFKTDDYATVPGSSIDALSVFLHEIGHGLGIAYLGDESGAPGVSVYDTLVWNGRFIGNNAKSAYGGLLGPGVPLESTNLAHVSESALGDDLMSPRIERGVNVHISDLDLGILLDIGVPVVQPTDDDDILHAIANSVLYLGAGNDIGYALANGSSVQGESGNDRLIGARGHDSLYGQEGNDDLEGAGQDDYLDGGSGLDVSRYSGLASDYQVLHLGGSQYRIMDLRPFSPDGTDDLVQIEVVRWGDGSFTQLNKPPIVTTQNRSLIRNEAVDLYDLFQVSDPENDIIQMYQLWDSTRDPNSGHFTINGVAQAAGTVITVAAADLPATAFVAGTVADNLQIRAYDGANWSAPDSSSWAPFTVTPTYPPPVVTTANVNLTFNQTVALSSLFSVTQPNGQPMTRYQLWDSNRDSTSGYFTVNGVRKAAGTVIDITAADLTQTFFVVGSAASDGLQIRAFDGLAWSALDDAAWSPFTVIAGLGQPAVTVSDITLPTNTKVPLSSLFSVTTPNGPIMEYRLWDSDLNPSSGFFTINDVVQPANATITLNAGNLAQAFFVTGTAVGDDLKIAAVDGRAAAPDIHHAPSFHVSLSGPPNHRPEWTLGNRSPGGGFFYPFGKLPAQRNTTLAPSLFSFAYDADGDTITKYQILDTTTDPLSGHWVVDGVAQAAGTVLDLTPAQWAQTVFVTSRMSDDLQMRIFDGKDWSATPVYDDAHPYAFIPGDIAWGNLKIAVPNNAPIVSTPNRSLGRGQSLTLTQLASVSDADGDTITHYQLFDFTGEAGSGNFVVNNVMQSAGSVIDVLPDDTVYFLGGSVDNTLAIRASDGIDWSAPESSTWSLFTVAAVPNRIPVVSGLNMMASRGQTLALSSLITVTDADGDSMTKYQLWDSNRDSASGYFTVNGVQKAAGTAIEITATEVSQTSFVAGRVNDRLEIRAFDGLAWSAPDNGSWAPLTVSVPPNRAPGLSTSDRTGSPGQSLTLSSLITVTDADGDGMAKYQLWDSTRDSASGHWVVDGVAKAAGTVIEVTAAQLGSTAFVAGSVMDRLEIRAFDGLAWTAADADAWAPFTVSPPVNHAPTLTTGDKSRSISQSLSLSSLITVTDVDGDSMTKYQLWDSNRSSLSGNWVVGGVTQAPGTVVEITAAQVASTAFVTGRVNDRLEIRAFDGAAWSAGDTAAWAPFTISVPANNAPVLTTGPLTPMHGRSLALSSLITVTDADGDAMTKYQLWDSSRDPLSGYFSVNGVKQAAGTVIEISAAQAASTVFVTGQLSDRLEIRAFDGISWSEADSAPWAPFNVTVTPYTAPSLSTS
ncbi:MAG TPA: hypothetical protein VJS47_04800, partial [Rhizomicrobium sp.]|nr:hypothetical protein [Rhizomicrobium sp.]